MGRLASLQNGGVSADLGRGYAVGTGFYCDGGRVGWSCAQARRKLGATPSLECAHVHRHHH